jgi:hypothetical protein
MQLAAHTIPSYIHKTYIHTHTDGTAKAAERASKGGEDKAFKRAREKEQRWTRIVANDLENVPLGLIVAWGSLQSPKNPQVWYFFR